MHIYHDPLIKTVWIYIYGSHIWSAYTSMLLYRAYSFSIARPNSLDIRLVDFIRLTN